MSKKKKEEVEVDGSLGISSQPDPTESIYTSIMTIIDLAYSYSQGDHLLKKAVKKLEALSSFLFSEEADFSPPHFFIGQNFQKEHELLNKYLEPYANLIMEIKRTLKKSNQMPSEDLTNQNLKEVFGSQLKEGKVHVSLLPTREETLGRQPTRLAQYKIFARFSDQSYETYKNYRTKLTSFLEAEKKD